MTDERTERFLEISQPGKGLEGVIGIGISGYATIHENWLRELLVAAGYEYEEVGA